MLATALFVALACPVEPNFGTLGTPGYRLESRANDPRSPYQPQPGDVLLFSDTNLFWASLYAIALTGKPGHGGIVVRMADGRLGVFESGYNDTLVTQVTPLERRLAEYRGSVWVRTRSVPLTDEQSRLLSEFAAAADPGYALLRFGLQITPFRSRGPIRTAFFGKPIGIGRRYHCASAVLEAAVYAGLLPADTTRPWATYPRDLFFDRSSNRYVDRHLDLRAAGWEPPARWRP